MLQKPQKVKHYNISSYLELLAKSQYNKECRTRYNKEKGLLDTLRAQNQHKNKLTDPTPFTILTL